MPEPRKLRVLYVDDDAIDRLAFERLVRRAQLPWEHVAARSVVEAREQLAARSFDAVVTDFSLGDGTALEVLSAARGAATIIVTGAGDERSAVQGMKAGAFDYLVKDQERAYLSALPRVLEGAVREKERDRRIGVLSQALRSIADSVYVTELDGRVSFVNAAFVATYGWSEDEVLGRSSELLWAAPPPAEGAESEWRGETVQRARSGRAFRVSLSRSPVRDSAGAAVALVWVARDMTERDRVEAELRAANSELERSRAALQELAIRDELTGLFNRREMNRLLDDEVARALRHGRALSMLLLDVDHFKVVNDTHGHDAGDAALRALSALLVRSLRSVDRVARYGGEEIAAVLPETDGAEAMQLAERLRATISGHAITAVVGGERVELHLTVSIGVASLPSPGSAHALILAADSALYSAKRAGRDRCALYEAAEAAGTSSPAA